MKKTTVMLSALVVAALGFGVFAQTQTNDQTQTTQTQMQNNPMFELMMTIRGLYFVDHNADTTLSKEQAKNLVPVLQKLQGFKTLDATNSAETTKAIKAILNKTQLDALTPKRNGKQQGRGGFGGHGGKPGFGGRGDHGGGFNHGQGRDGQGADRQDKDGQGKDGRPDFTLEGNPFAGTQSPMAWQLGDMIKLLQMR